MKIKWIKSMVY